MDALMKECHYNLLSYSNEDLAFLKHFYNLEGSREPVCRRIAHLHSRSGYINESELRNKTLRELIEIAKSRYISYSGLNKRQLIEKLMSVEEPAVMQWQYEVENENAPLEIRKLMRAIMTGNLPELRELYHGQEIPAYYNIDRAIVEAMRRGHYNVVRYMVVLGISPHSADRKDSLISLASKQSNKDMLVFLRKFEHEFASNCNNPSSLRNDIEFSDVPLDEVVIDVSAEGVQYCFTPEEVLFEIANKQNPYTGRAFSEEQMEDARRIVRRRGDRIVQQDLPQSAVPSENTELRSLRSLILRLSGDSNYFPDVSVVENMTVAQQDHLIRLMNLQLNSVELRRWAEAEEPKRRLLYILQNANRPAEDLAVAINTVLESAASVRAPGITQALPEYTMPTYSPFAGEEGHVPPDDRPRIAETPLPAGAFMTRPPLPPAYRHLRLDHQRRVPELWLREEGQQIQPENAEEEYNRYAETDNYQIYIYPMGVSSRHVQQDLALLLRQPLAPEEVDSIVGYVNNIPFRRTGQGNEADYISSRDVRNAAKRLFPSRIRPTALNMTLDVAQMRGEWALVFRRFSEANRERTRRGGGISVRRYPSIWNTTSAMEGFNTDFYLLPNQPYTQQQMNEVLQTRYNTYVQMTPPLQQRFEYPFGLNVRELMHEFNPILTRPLSEAQAQRVVTGSRYMLGVNTERIKEIITTQFPDRWPTDAVSTPSSPASTSSTASTPSRAASSVPLRARRRGRMTSADLENKLWTRFLSPKQKRRIPEEWLTDPEETALFSDLSEHLLHALEYQYQLYQQRPVQRYIYPLSSGGVNYTDVEATAKRDLQLSITPQEADGIAKYVNSRALQRGVVTTDDILDEIISLQKRVAADPRLRLQNLYNIGAVEKDVTV